MWTTAPPIDDAEDVTVVAEYRKRKSCFTAAEWRAMDPAAKSHLLDEAREAAALQKRTTWTEKQGEGPKALDLSRDVPVDSAMSVFEQMCARAKAIANLKRIEAMLLSVDHEDEVEARGWRCLRFKRTGSPPPLILPRPYSSDDDSAPSSGDEAGLTRRKFSFLRPIFRRSILDASQEDGGSCEHKFHEDVLWPERRRSVRLLQSRRRRLGRACDDNNADQQQPSHQETRVAQAHVVDEGTTCVERRRSMRILLAKTCVGDHSTDQSNAPAQDTSSPSTVSRGSARSKRESRGQKDEVDSLKHFRRDRIDKAVPKVGSVVRVLFDDGNRYRGIVKCHLGGSRARIVFADGDVDETDFPDPDVEVVRIPEKEPADKVAEQATRLEQKEDGQPESAPDLGPVKDMRSSKSKRRQQGVAPSSKSEPNHQGRVRTSCSKHNGLDNKKTPDNAPPVGTVTRTLFDDGVRYRGVVIARVGRNRARIRYDDDEEEDITFPDPDVDVVVEEQSESSGNGSFPGAANCSEEVSQQSEREAKAEKLESDKDAIAVEPATCETVDDVCTTSQCVEDSDLASCRARDRAARACAMQLSDAKLAAQLQEEEDRIARRLRVSLRENPCTPPRIPKPPSKRSFQREPKPPQSPSCPPIHVLFSSTAITSPTTPQAPLPRQADLPSLRNSCSSLATMVNADTEQPLPCNSSTGEDYRPTVLVNTDALQPPSQRAREQGSDSQAATASDKATTAAWCKSSALAPPTKQARTDVLTRDHENNNDDEDDGSRCPVCLSDDGFVVTLWCCRKRACHSCLGRLGDFGFRCFFCRASVPPRRVRAMLSDEPEWPPARLAAGDLIKRVFTIGREGFATRSRRKRRRDDDEDDTTLRRSHDRLSCERPNVRRRDLRSSRDFVGEVIALESSLWYSARDAETPDYVANALRCSASRIVVLTNTSTTPRCLPSRPYVPLVSEHEALSEGRLLRLPSTVADASGHASGDAIWVVPPRTATELLEGEAYCDDLDNRVWYSTREDETPDRVAALFGIEASGVTSNTAKLAHLSSRRAPASAGSGSVRHRVPEALGRRVRLKARTVVLLPASTSIPDLLIRRKPCAACRVSGNRGANTCRVVLGHSAPDFDEPRPTLGSRVRVRWLLGDNDDHEARQPPPVWGWYFGTVTRVNESSTKVALVYDREEPEEDEQTWPNEDIVMLPEKGTGAGQLRRDVPDDRLLQAIVGKRLGRAGGGSMRVVHAYVSFVEGFDGTVVVLKPDSTGDNESEAGKADEDHHLLADLCAERLTWLNPKDALIATAILEGRSPDEDPEVENTLAMLRAPRSDTPHALIATMSPSV